MNTNLKKKFSFLVNLSVASAALLGTMSVKANAPASHSPSVAAIQGATIPDGLIIAPSVISGPIQNDHYSHYSHRSHSSHQSHSSHYSGY